MGPHRNKNLSDEDVLFNSHLSRKRSATVNMIVIWIKSFRIFVNRSNLTPDKAFAVAMAALTLYNPGRFKPRHSYTSKSFADGTESNENSILQNYLAHFLSPGSKNRKKISLKKNLYFQEMELSDSNIKKFLIFQETETLKNLLYPKK